MSLIDAEDVRKVYRRGAEEVRALDGVSFQIEKGDFVAVIGPSGAGKSTLLQLLGAMDRPTSGHIRVADQDLSNLSESDLTRLRREEIGFVFQHFGLLPTLSVEENIALPRTLAKGREGARVEDLLERVGLSHRRKHRPAELSGGEMQRVAIARSLINRPQLLLADEPTGNLDSATSTSILDLLTKLNREEGITLIVVTHNDTLAAAAHRHLALKDGRLV